MKFVTIPPGVHDPSKESDLGYPFDKTLVFEPGLHEFQTTAKKRAMRLGDNVRLTGKPGAIIRLSGDGVFAMGVGSENIIVEGLTIERTGFAGISNFATAMEFRGCRNVEVSDCKITGHGGMGIKLCRDCGYAPDGRPFDMLGDSLVSTRNVLIRDCVFEQIAGAAIGCKPGGASHVDILRCRIDGFGSYGVCIEGDAGGGRRGCVSHVTVADCEITNGDPVKFHGKNDSCYGIYVGEDAHDITIRGNTIDNLRAANRECGVAVCTSPSQGDRPVSGVRILDNGINNNRWPVFLWQGKSSITGIEMMLRPARCSLDCVVKCWTGHERYKVLQ